MDERGIKLTIIKLIYIISIFISLIIWYKYFTSIIDWCKMTNNEKIDIQKYRENEEKMPFHYHYLLLIFLIFCPILNFYIDVIILTKHNSIKEKIKEKIEKYRK